MTIRFLAIISIMILCKPSVSATAQDVQYIFKHFSTEEGLSNGKIDCIAKDTRGYIWVGSESGLDRFDGFEFVHYVNVPNDLYSLTDNVIRDILVDQKGRLWIGTQLGLHLYDAQRNRFIRIPDESGNEITGKQIIEGADQKIYILSKSKIYQLTADDSSAKALLIPQLDTFLDRDDVLNRIYLDRQNKLWLGFTSAGLLCYEQETGGIHHFTTVGMNRLPSNHILDLVQDREDNIWVATSNGLCRVEPGTYHITTFRNIPQNPLSLSTNDCYCLAVDQNDQLLIGTNGGGLNLLKIGQNRFVRIGHNTQDKYSLNNNSVQTIYIENSDNIWVGTLKGLNLIKVSSNPFFIVQNIIEQPNPFTGQPITCFQEDRDHNVWLGIDGGGLHYLNRKTKKVNSYFSRFGEKGSLHSNSILSILEDRNGRLWIGGFLLGLDIFDRETQKFKHILHSEDGLIKIKHDDVRCIYADREGDIWIATNGDGLFRFIDGKLNQYMHYTSSNINIPDEIATNFCTTIYEDRGGLLWIGTYNGITVLDQERRVLKNYGASGVNTYGLSNTWIYCFKEDSQGRLWIGTAEGLNLFDRNTQSFISFGVREGLPGEIICGILDDQDGFFWISTNKGLIRFDPNAYSLKVFTVHNGLHGNEFIRGAYAKLSTGELIFGSTDGFDIFLPEKIKRMYSSPPVFINRIHYYSVKQQSDLTQTTNSSAIPVHGQIVLTYEEAQVLSIDFSALEFFLPEKIRYRYLLAGYHQHWMEVGSNRSATFFNLKPGTYSFQVTSTDEDGNWSNQLATLSIKVLSPWWRKWYTYLAYVVLAFLVLYIAHNYYVKLVHLRLDLKHQKLDKEKISELEALKSRFFTNISHEFRMPLTLILTPLNDLLKKGPHVEWQMVNARYGLMKKSAERLMRLVDQVIDFNRIELGQMKLNKKEIDFIGFVKSIVDTFTPLAVDKNIILKFESDFSKHWTLVDPDKIDMVVFNLLSNAFKFTPSGGEITVSVQKCREEELQLKVKDTGPGIPAEHIQSIFNRFYQYNHPGIALHSGSGIGLALSKELVDLHDGQLLVESKPGEGACFILSLPVGNITIYNGDHEIPSPIEANLLTQQGQRFEGDALINGSEDVPLLLVVEDEQELRDFLKEELSANYKMLTARNGNEGWELAQKYLPDLIISDVMMYEMNGVELCRKIKETELTNHIPVFLLTARVTEEQQIEALGTRADDYLTKPFNLEILKIRIHNLLESRKMIRQRFSQQIWLMPKNVVITSLDEQFIERVMEIVENNLTDKKFDVQILSQKIGLSRAQLFRKIKAIMSLTPNEFIQTMRLKRAAQLLEKSTMNITEICYEVGFNYPSHFAKLFQEHFGIQPREYRHTHSNSTKS